MVLPVSPVQRKIAKYIFNVPEELWSTVKGRFLSEQTSTCYEILWNDKV